jgi:hypothetical protein
MLEFNNGFIERRNQMSLRQEGISVCNDGNVSQIDVADPGGVYYRIEVYRASQPSGGYGVTLSGSRVEDICGIEHLKPRSNQIFRYIFSLGTVDTHKGDFPVVLEGREEFNPAGMPDGSWHVRIRDLDDKSPAYGSIISATVKPTGKARSYDIEYTLSLADPTIKHVPIRSPLPSKLSDINPDLADISINPYQLAQPIEVRNAELVPKSEHAHFFSLTDATTSEHITSSMHDVTTAISHPQFKRFRENLDAYEAFGDFGAKAVHPGTNLIGPNKALAAESIFVRQYRAALVLFGRITSPDMERGAHQPLSLAKAATNTRPGVYAIFVGAAINNIGIYKLGLDKVHSDYGGIPMKLAPGSRLEDDAVPIADAWRCNQTLGEIANTYYLANPPAEY